MGNNLAPCVSGKAPQEYSPDAIDALRIELLREMRKLEDQLPRSAEQAISENHAVKKAESDGMRKSTTTLQMQIAFFRLLQGAAYRVHRPSWSAHHETHKRVVQLPYVLPAFVEFVGETITWYKALDIVDPACHPVLDKVTLSVDAMLRSLQSRIKSFNEKTLSAGEAKAFETHVQEVKKHMGQRVAFANMLQKDVKKLRVGAASHGSQTNNSFSAKDMWKSMQDNLEPLVRMADEERELEMAIENEETRDYVEKARVDPADMKKWKDSTWNYVIMDPIAEQEPGAMVPVSYWYDDFMPKLLAAFSVATESDVEALRIGSANEEAETWFSNAKKRGEFDKFGQDILQNWDKLEPVEKLVIRQAWRLTVHYLNGVQKQRERCESGAQHRGTGYLSMYVAFIDAYLGRSDIRDAGMRVSFPYYIGNAVWTQFHTSAEIVCAKATKEQTAMIGVFKEFLLGFAQNYPCPYCRHHFNVYVKLTQETDLYPLEYLLLGWKDHGPEDFLRVSLEDKLATITDGPSLRMFLWKLHNAVNSSISRGEDWFHRVAHSVYTNRYWPSMAYEIQRVESLNIPSMSSKRTSDIYQLESFTAELSRLREDLTAKDCGCSSDQAKSFYEHRSAIAQKALQTIAEMDAHMERTRVLQNSFSFDRNSRDEDYTFSWNDEKYARSGLFSLR